MSCEKCKLPITGQFDVNMTGEVTCYHCGSTVYIDSIVKYNGKKDYDGVTVHDFTMLVVSKCPGCNTKIWNVKCPCSDGEGGNFWRVEDLIREPVQLIPREKRDK